MFRARVFVRQTLLPVTSRNTYTHVSTNHAVSKFLAEPTNNRKATNLIAQQEDFKTAHIIFTALCAKTRPDLFTLRAILGACKRFDTYDNILSLLSCVDVKLDAATLKMLVHASVKLSIKDAAEMSSQLLQYKQEVRCYGFFANNSLTRACFILFFPHLLRTKIWKTQ